MVLLGLLRAIRIFLAPIRCGSITTWCIVLVDLAPDLLQSLGQLLVGQLDIFNFSEQALGVVSAVNERESEHCVCALLLECGVV